MQSYYLELEIPDVGTKHLAEILNRIESLSENPGIGRVVSEFSEFHISEIIHSPYRIVYLRDKKSIQVVRIWRNERLLELPGVRPSGVLLGAVKSCTALMTTIVLEKRSG